MGHPHQFRKAWAEPAEAARPQAADDHLENHLLTEENRRLKDELRRVESALKVAARVLAPYFEHPRR